MDLSRGDDLRPSRSVSDAVHHQGQNVQRRAHARHKAIPCRAAAHAARRRGKTEDVQLSDFHLGPIASVLASLPDADFEYVVNACLDVTELKQPDGGFAPVRVKGVVMFPFDLSTLIGIVWNVLKGNLSGFFGDLGSALSAKGPTSPSNG